MTAPTALAASLALLLASGAACDATDEPPAQPATVVAWTGPVGALEGTSPDAAVNVAPPTWLGVTDRLDTLLARRYREGLAAGRERTARREYAAAIAGFDEALTAVPDDPRALAGRGHVRLLIGELARASEDLALAAEGASDPKLAATAHFDRGLVLERRGEAEAALREFTLANTLGPSSAAAAKIAGRSVCVATLDERPGEAPAPTTWRGVWATHFEPIKSNLKDTSTPADELSARDRICRYEVLSRDACEGPSPWLVRVPGPGGAVELADQVALIGEQGAEVTLTPIYPVGGGGACDDHVEATIVARDPLVVRVTVTHSAIGRVCGGKKIEPDSAEDQAGCHEACVTGRGDTITRVFTPDTLRPWLTARTPDRPGDGAPVVAVDVTASGATLRGGGCERRVARP
ncbi:MAG: hypothetical protein JNL82_29150 [Myxococcales bacterium]|nr:hypothetical protein [Myxococcales bacterium]